MEAAIAARNALSALREGFLKTTGVALSPSYDLLAGQLEEIKRWESFPQEIFEWMRTAQEMHTVDELLALLTKKKKYAEKRKKDFCHTGLQPAGVPEKAQCPQDKCHFTGSRDTDSYFRFSDLFCIRFSNYVHEKHRENHVRNSCGLNAFGRYIVRQGAENIA